MANYGFVIDNRSCIGCHACSVACKEENSVPLGVYRTWVKYVETGTFPDARRHFQVTRCNHCANPPCVRICPVTAMYQRQDGIVEFDPEVCIGCKACLQACPYDAIYIDPETHAAAKCHYCAHRTEIGLEPACVLVCPTHAIISGDLDDPESEISHMVSRYPVTVRKPEQGTAPKLFYIEGNAVALTPTAAPVTNTFMWADMASDQAQSMVPRAKVRGAASDGSLLESLAKSGVPIRTPGSQALGVGRNALMLGGRQAGQMVQTAYNAQHKVPWHWPVPAYLVTKGIASGIVLMLAVAQLMGDPVMAVYPLPLFVALLFAGATTALLVLDLEKPRMFLTILTRPQWRSWLTRGAFVLIAFSAVTGIWLSAELNAVINSPPAEALVLAGSDTDFRAWGRESAAWLSVPLAVLTAIYTAFLFAQAEGRDLWQSPLLPFHFLIQAVVAGAAGMVLMNLAGPYVFTWMLYEPIGGYAPYNPFPGVLAAALLLNLFVTLVGEFAIPHASEVAARAAHAIQRGKYARWFWIGGIVIGHLLPIALLMMSGVQVFPPGWALGGAALAALIGLYCYEYAFVMAPQEVPNS